MSRVLGNLLRRQISIGTEITGVDLIPDVLPFGRLWYGEPDPISNAIG
jgi:hypothetical protein